MNSHSTQPQPSSTTSHPLHYITKSKILSLERCENLFRYNFLNPNPSPKSSENYYGLENGKVKELALDYFPGGTRIPNLESVELAHQASIQAMDGNKTIYRPLFLYEDLLAFPEILTPNDKNSYTAWDISTSINTKRDMELGIAFNKYVIDKLNLPITEYKILKINPKYIYQDKIDIEQFFLPMNFTTKLDQHREHLMLILNELENLKKNPNYKVSSKKCSSYKSCVLPEYCYPDLKEGNIFTLREASQTSIELYNQGIHFLKDIPPDTELTDKQRIQIQVDRTQLPHIDTEPIEKFLSKIQYPTYYLDFETINPQIPIYNSTKPYQHIPFLFSLHILESKSSDEPIHHTYIQMDRQDPRPEILAQLSNLIQPNGTILCFNDFFEKRCLDESTKIYTEFRPWYESIKPHFLDSAIPFKNLHYYSPDQKGSASLKDILPALTSTSHSHLDIQNGHLANLEYLKFLRNADMDEDEKSTLFNQLMEYCKMDSYALFLIQKELQRIVAEG